MAHPSKKNFKTLSDFTKKDDESIFIVDAIDIFPGKQSIGCGNSRLNLPDEGVLAQFLSGESEANCITCTQGNCGPSPAGYESSPRWTKSNGQEQNCQNCNEDPYRWVPWYNDGGGCFDETNKCYWLRQAIINCTAGDPPQPWTCYEYQFLECQPQDCSNADQDNDGYYKRTATCFPPSDEEDCNDDPNNGGANQSPGHREICNDANLVDENCDEKRNCEDPTCRETFGSECDAQCDTDEDDHYSLACGGDDCDDECGYCYPEEGRTENNFGGIAPCSDGKDGDCDGTTDCGDADCASDPSCQSGGGGEPQPGQTYCSGAYEGTDWYYYDNETMQWYYAFTTWEWSMECFLIQ